MKKIKRLFVLGILILLKNSPAFSQNYTYYGNKIYGGSLSEKSVQILKYDNNHLIIAGVSSTNLPSGNKTAVNCSNSSDVWMIMIDTALNIIWDKSLGGAATEGGISSIVKTTNNEIAFATQSNSDSSCEKSENNKMFPLVDYDYWICSVASSGNKIWDKTLGSLGADEYPYLTQLSNGNFLVVGSNSSGIGGDKTVTNYGGSDFWAIQFDSLGNKLWDNVYGGSGFEPVYSGNNNGFNVLATENGSFILNGSTDSPISGNISSMGYGGFDVWIIKVDSAGNKIWDNRFGGSSGEIARMIIPTTDGGYMLLSTTDSPQGGTVSQPPIGGGDVWVLKLDSLGNKQWDKRYGGTGADFGISIASAPDGGYWISANTTSPVGFDVTEPPYGLQDYWIFKIDSAGNKLWDKRFGGPRYNYVSNFAIMPDSSIFLCGYADTGTTAVKTEFGYGSYDYWVVHFKYSDNSVGINSSLNPNYQILISPNPSNGIVNLKSDFNVNTSVIVYNSIGEKVYNQKTILEKQNTLNFSYLNKGLYFLKVDNEKYSKTIKFVIQ